MQAAGFQSIQGIKLHVVRRGDAHSHAPPLLWLHGFPDLGSIWQRVIDHLPQDRLSILPDQRGYHPSDKPPRVKDYAPEILLEDIRQLIHTNSPSGKVVLVGHDWGGVIGCWFAACFPQHVHRLILINAVHPAALQTALIQSPGQRAASAYMTALKSGALEAMWQADPASNPFKIWFQEAQADGRMGAEEAALYEAAWSDPDRWRAAIDWYRASPFELNPGPDLSAWMTSPSWTIQTPTHLIWGEADPVFTLESRDAMAGYFANLTCTALKHVGHNPVRDAPVSVAHAIHRFLTQGNHHD
ncbi:alpha/beta fold hydrolase [Aquidulcibacter paucihalophilus]|uniref:alpha/beta fold hydrolase n=1 Tax=Aquidulcibacter paucihalophilus TaxID=1978549 RepID=UPI000A18CF20|nr:alpha/beta hydrolase [Aquidulcibacter paucihalophilus]